MSEVQTAKPAIDPADLPRRQEETEKIVTPFRYRKPDDSMGKRAAVGLCKTDLYRARIVVMKKGYGETNLHYHTGADSFWMVLKGRVRFYGPGETLIGEFGPNEGTSTPRYSRYWFENCGDEDLEMVHIFANARAGENDTGRTDAVPRPDYMPPIGSVTKKLDAAH